MTSIAARASPRSRICCVSGATPSRAEATLDRVNAVCRTTSATRVRAIDSRKARTSSSLGACGSSAMRLSDLLHQRRVAGGADLAGERLLERRAALDGPQQPLGAVALVEHPLDRPQVRLETERLDLWRGRGQQPADTLGRRH